LAPGFSRSTAPFLLHVGISSLLIEAIDMRDRLPVGCADDEAAFIVINRPWRQETRTQFRRAVRQSMHGRSGRRRQMPSEFERPACFTRASATITPTSRAEHTSCHGIVGAGDAALASELRGLTGFIADGAFFRSANQCRAQPPPTRRAWFQWYPAAIFQTWRQYPAPRPRSAGRDPVQSPPPGRAYPGPALRYRL
jgi:hypothetical protein